MRRTATLVAAVGALLALFAGAALAATIDGTVRADKIVGTEGDDTIRGFGGKDTIYGGSGQDSLKGNPGDDTVAGGDGDDVVSGGPGRDTVQGGDGNDVLEMRDGIAGNDTARCGFGQDMARVDSRGEALIRNASAVPIGEKEGARCEALEYRAELTGVVQPGAEIAPPEVVIGTHQIVDEASRTGYQLQSETVDLGAYVGRRVTVSGPVEERVGGGSNEGRVMDVERIDER